MYDMFMGIPSLSLQTHSNRLSFFFISGDSISSDSFLMSILLKNVLNFCIRSILLLKIKYLHKLQNKNIINIVFKIRL